MRRNNQQWSGPPDVMLLANAVYEYGAASQLYIRHKATGK